MQATAITDAQDPDRITLREHRPADVEDVLAMCQDPAMQQWTTVPVPYLRADAEAFLATHAAEWARGEGWGRAIEAADDDGRPRFAGNLSLRPDGAGGAEVGFGLAPWARGRGIMSRAVRLLLQQAFAAPEAGGGGLQVVHWKAHVGNWDSRRVAWSCGFAVEGTVRGLCAQRGELHDGWIGSVVAGDPLAPTTPWLEAAVLVGERVVLRPWREDDVPRAAEACSDALTQHWLPQLPSPYTVADAQWYVRSREEEHARGEGVHWCVADPDDDRCLGAISLSGLAGPLPKNEIGYWAHPDARRRGVMTEAAARVVRHALIAVEEGGLGVHRVSLRAAAGNVGSRRVAEGAGMRQCGVAREADLLRDGSREDHLLFEALADDVAPQGVVSAAGR